MDGCTRRPPRARRLLAKVRGDGELAAVLDDDLGLGGAALGALGLDQADDVQALEHLSRGGGQMGHTLKLLDSTRLGGSVENCHSISRAVTSPLAPDHAASSSQ